MFKTFAVEVNCFHVTHILANLMIDSIHAWLEKYYRLPWPGVYNYGIYLIAETLGMYETSLSFIL